MSRPQLAAREPVLEGLRVLVLGLGRSGLAAARLARAKKARVTVADRRDEDELGEAAQTARALGASVHAGGHPAELANTADLIVVSPGVPSDVDLLRAARAMEIPLWGEIELAARFCAGRVIGITGSNGKSTVTSMTGEILRAAGLPGGTGGNLATPFCTLLDEDSQEAVHALELSSFQLETIEAFRPEVALLLNLSPDHLDRYPSYDAYAAAKARLLEAQDGQGDTVLNADDAESERFHASVRGRLHLFSTRGEVLRGAFLRGGRLVLRLDEGDIDLLGVDELPVPGEHNAANALAAALACHLIGCAPRDIAAGLRGYRALPHRLERVATLNGVAFYNDSKATNPAAAAMALGSFASGAVHVILGGKDKGVAWDELLPLVERHARRALLVGQAAEVLRERLAGLTELVECGTVARAVEEGFRAARPGEVVLLSPACASFDQYGSFEERGEDFRAAVLALRPEGGADA